MPLDELDSPRAPLLQSLPAKYEFIAAEGVGSGRLLHGQRRENPGFAGKTRLGWT